MKNMNQLCLFSNIVKMSKFEHIEHNVCIIQSYEIKLLPQAFLDGRSLPGEKLR